MKERFFTAFIYLGIGAPVILFLGPYALYLFTLLILVACLYEYFSMTTKNARLLRNFSIVTSSFLLFISIFLRSYLLPFLVFTFIVYSLFFILMTNFYKNKISPKDSRLGDLFIDYTTAIYGVFFLTLFLSYIPMLRSSGLKWVILLMAVVWFGDTGAFIIGRKYGQIKLSPNLSPNKTVEGALGGLTFSFLACLICKFSFFNTLDLIDCLNISIIGGIFGQIGDLTESFIKRSCNEKDSGKVMPGHGGIFDRFDGLIFAAPFFYFYARMFF